MREGFGEQLNKPEVEKIPAQQGAELNIEKEKVAESVVEKEIEPEKITGGITEAVDGLLGKIDQYAFSEEAEKLVGDYLSRKIQKDEFQEGLKDLERREKNVKKAIDRLQSEGLITEKDERGNLVVDLERLAKFSVRQHALKMNLVELTGETDRYAMLSRIFKNRGVISKEDFENGIREPKDLIFSPRTKEEALSIPNLRGDNFYFSPLDFTASSEKGHRTRVTKGLEPYPSLVDKSLSRLEVATLLLIYNKNYGNGYRDENGVLLVKDPDTGEYRKISTSFFQKHAFGVVKEGENRGKAQAIYHNPRSFIKKFLPNIEGDLLSPEDFRMISGLPSTKEERMMRDFPEAIRNQAVTMNNVMHYLGSEFKGKHIRVHQITENLAGITEVSKDKQEKLTHIFDIAGSPETPRRKTKYDYRTSKEIGLREYDEKEFSTKRADETDEDYGRRLEAMKDFLFMVDFSKDLSERAGIDLRKWTFQEQKIVSAAARTFNYQENREKILSFAERFGEDGLKTFLTAEYDTKNGQKIMEIAESIGEEEAESIFAEYGKILKSAGGFYNIFKEAQGIRNSQVLPPELKNIFAGEVREAIIRRSKDVLMALYPIAVEKKQTQLNVKDVSSSLRGLKTFLGVAETLSGERKDYRIEKADAVNDRNFILLVAGPDNHQYKFKIFVRPFEEEVAKGGQKYIDQARINFELDFNTERPDGDMKEAFKQTQYDKTEKKLKIQHVLRVGIDRDVIDKGSPERKISIDLGRSELKGERVERSGDVLGKVLHLTTETGHHNPKSFDQRFAQAEYFGEIAELLRDHLVGKAKQERG